MRHQSGRNYALDMLPIFAHLDPKFIRRTLDEPLNKPRPAFHFRMPNCRIDEPNWRFATEWHHWLAVERVAHDDELRADLMEHYQKYETHMLNPFDTQWVKQVEAALS